MAGGPFRYLGRRFVHRILQINDTPRAIALGTSIGAFLAMTPTVGIQLILAAVVCTAVRANRIAAFVMVFISNPLTMLPIYWVDYWLGSKLTGGVRMTQQDFYALWQRILDAGMIGGMREGFHVLVGDLGFPMMVGGSVLGLLLAIPLFPITRRAVRAHRRRREARIAYERLRELRAEVGSPSSGYGVGAGSAGGGVGGERPVEKPVTGGGPAVGLGPSGDENLPEVHREESMR